MVTIQQARANVARAVAAVARWQAEQFHGDPSRPNYPHGSGGSGAGSRSVSAPVLGSDAAIEAWADKTGTQEYTESLSGADKKALQAYAGANYREINKGLRTEKLSADVQAKVDKLDGLMQNAPALTESVTVFRGMSSDRLASAGVGTVFNDKAYVSSSLSQEIGTSFTEGEGYLMQIALPAGTRGVFTDGAAKYVDEYEYILPRGSSFRVTGVSGRTVQAVLIVDK